MKKIPINILFTFFCFFESFILFSQPLYNFQDKNFTGINKSSFGVFSSDYDSFLSSLFWQKTTADNLSVYSGIDENTLNIGFSKNLTENLYSAFLFQEKITNYKWWPQNMTDESWTVLMAWKSFMAKAGYYDYCISEGLGTALPYLFLGNKWQIKDNELHCALGFDVAMQFGSGNKMDVFQPKAHFLFSFGKNQDEGLILKYRIMGTYASAHNITNVNNAPLLHEFFVSYGKIWKLLPNLSVGIKPIFDLNLNAINPTKMLISFLPSKNEFDLYFALPLALKIYPTEKQIFSFVTSIKIDIFYASYDHLGYNGLGGNNYSGWVPGIGFGVGGRFAFSDKCFLDFGINYTAIPQVTKDLNEHEYELKNVSVQSLLESPFTVSLQINF